VENTQYKQHVRHKRFVFAIERFNGAKQTHNHTNRMIPCEVLIVYLVCFTKITRHLWLNSVATFDAAAPRSGTTALKSKNNFQSSTHRHQQAVHIVTVTWAKNACGSCFLGKYEF